MKIYGVLDVEESCLVKEDGVRQAEASAWMRNKFIIRERHEEELKLKGRGSR